MSPFWKIGDSGGVEKAHLILPNLTIADNHFQRKNRGDQSIF
jgi:hypothetical protein